MTMDEELVDFIRAKIRRCRGMIMMALRELDRLERSLSRGELQAEEYRDCAMSEADWRMVKPVADLLFDGQWVSAEDYALVRDTLIDYAEELARLFPESEIRDWMFHEDMPKEEDEK